MSQFGCVWVMLLTKWPFWPYQIVNKPKMTIARARIILGEEYVNYFDLDIQELIDFLYLLATLQAHHNTLIHDQESPDLHPCFNRGAREPV